MKKIILLLLILITPALLTAQRSKKPVKDEDEDQYPKFEFGINFGTYFANPYSANYYNGSEENVNKISLIFKNKYWYDEIKLLLSADDTVVLRELPQDMHYNAALTGGLFLRYNITKNNSIFLEANYARLKTDDGFTVEVDPQGVTFQDLRVFGIHGQEERINIDLGYHRKFPVYKNKMNLFLQGGANVNYVKVLKAFVNFYDKEYSFINIYGSNSYVPGAYTQQIDNIQDGFGFGFVAGGGIGFTFTPQVGAELGGNFIYTKVNLEGYQESKPSYVAYLRLMLSNLISSEE